VLKFSIESLPYRLAMKKIQAVASCTIQNDCGTQVGTGDNDVVAITGKPTVTCAVPVRIGAYERRVIRPKATSLGPSQLQEVGQAEVTKLLQFGASVWTTDAS
jgi:hypothetical protein